MNGVNNLVNSHDYFINTMRMAVTLSSYPSPPLQSPRMQQQDQLVVAGHRPGFAAQPQIQMVQQHPAAMLPRQNMQDPHKWHDPVRHFYGGR